SAAQASNARRSIGPEIRDGASAASRLTAAIVAAITAAGPTTASAASRRRRFDVRSAVAASPAPSARSDASLWVRTSAPASSGSVAAAAILRSESVASVTRPSARRIARTARGHSRSEPDAAIHGQFRRSAPGLLEKTRARADAHAAIAPAHTHASGWKPPCVAPSAGMRTSGIAATARCTPVILPAASARAYVSRVKVAVLTTSYPRSQDDPAGRFVADAVEHVRDLALEV